MINSIIVPAFVQTQLLAAQDEFEKRVRAIKAEEKKGTEISQFHATIIYCVLLQRMKKCNKRERNL